MVSYKGLLSKMFYFKNNLETKLKLDSSTLNCYRKVKDVVNYSLTRRPDGAKLEKMFKLKRYLPNLSDEFNMFEQMNHYFWSLTNDIFNFKADELINDLYYSYDVYGIPSEEDINVAKDCMNVIDDIRSVTHEKYKVMTVNNTVDEIARKKAFKLIPLISIIDKVEVFFANLIIKGIKKEFEDIDENELAKEIEDIKNNLRLINKYSNMFSSDELLIKFNSNEEIEEFSSFIKNFLTDSEREEIVNKVKIDQKREKIKEEKITFDNLDFTKFTNEERNIINDMLEILVKEDLDDGELLTSDDISLSEYISIYQNKPISSVLLDIKNNLIKRIYTDKDDVLHIIKYVIDLYNKYILRITREEKIKELLRIRDDFNNIINFINRNYLDKSKAYEESSKLEDYVSDLETNYIPTLEDLISSNYPADEYFDKSFDDIIIDYREIINEYKKIMSSYNNEEKVIDEDKENTNNLVFCINDDINLTTEGHQKEFIGAIVELESKTTNELKSQIGRKGLTKLRKPNEYNKEEYFVDYLEKRYNMKIDFVPYRYSSASNFRTGLIKFEPSTVVKKYLERKYGLSKQCAIYGVFEIIQVIRADHSEYSYLHDYVVNNCLDIERIAKLFSSPNPNIIKLTNVIDSLLMIKKDKTSDIKNRLGK